MLWHVGSWELCGLLSRVLSTVRCKWKRRAKEAPLNLVYRALFCSNSEVVCWIVPTPRSWWLSGPIVCGLISCQSSTPWTSVRTDLYQAISDRPNNSLRYLVESQLQFHNLDVPCMVCLHFWFWPAKSVCCCLLEDFVEWQISAPSSLPTHLFSRGTKSGKELLLDNHKLCVYHLIKTLLPFACLRWRPEACALGLTKCNAGELQLYAFMLHFVIFLHWTFQGTNQRSLAKRCQVLIWLWITSPPTFCVSAQASRIGKLKLLTRPLWAQESQEMRGNCYSVDLTTMLDLQSVFCLVLIVHKRAENRKLISNVGMCTPFSWLACLAANVAARKSTQTNMFLLITHADSWRSYTLHMPCFLADILTSGYALRRFQEHSRKCWTIWNCKLRWKDPGKISTGKICRHWQNCQAFCDSRRIAHCFLEKVCPAFVCRIKQIMSLFRTRWTPLSTTSVVTTSMPPKFWTCEVTCHMCMPSIGPTISSCSH